MDHPAACGLDGQPVAAAGGGAGEVTTTELRLKDRADQGRELGRKRCSRLWQRAYELSGVALLFGSPPDGPEASTSASRRL